MSDPIPRPCPPRLEPVTLTGRFIRLEPLTREHLPDLAVAALSDPGTWDYFRYRVATPADVERMIESALTDAARGLDLPFVVIEPTTGAILGGTRFLDYRPEDRGVEIGWTWYVPDARGGVVNPEAKWLLLRHAFDVLGCIRVQFKTDRRNLRSRAAIARLGAVEEGTLRNHMVVHGGTIRDSVYFSITEGEWPSVNAGLQARINGHTAARGPAAARTGPLAP
jgi:RimJ/RimL family protein N-acetyltransferase